MVVQILTKQQLVVCVAFSAIQISEISRAQLQSSAKALNITTKKKEKKDLVKLVAEALVGIYKSFRFALKKGLAWRYSKTETILELGKF